MTTTTADLNFLGATARVLASTEDYGLVHMDMPAGEMPPLHVHRDEDEGFYCLGGDITLYLPGESVTLRAGDFILAPRGIPHSYEVGADGCRALVSSTPGGFEPLKTYTVADSATWAPPVISGNRVFVKDISTLALWTMN